jgi:hypothetical protein
MEMVSDLLGEDFGLESRLRDLMGSVRRPLATSRCRKISLFDGFRLHVGHIKGIEDDRIVWKQGRDSDEKSKGAPVKSTKNVTGTFTHFTR